MAHAHTTFRSIAAVSILLVSIVTGDSMVTNESPAKASLSTVEKATYEVVSAPVGEPSVVFSFDHDTVAYQDMVAAFTEAGFDVPVFRARFHADGGPCLDHHGLHVKTSDGLSTVHICFTHEREMFQDLSRAHTLLHEVAHAWVEQNVSEAQVAEFMALRGLTEWDRNASWGELGAEQAAEIFLWGMTGGS